MSEIVHDKASQDSKNVELSPRVAERFNAADSDLTLQSSDGVLYKVHRKNLVLHSETFAAADAISAATGAVDNSEIVSLSENSQTLDLLLQFMYRQRQPDLAVVDFKTLTELAEAAEKYEVYSAMAICHVHMRFAAVFHPAEVLRYAFKHDYPIIMDEAAPLTVNLSAEHLVNCWAPIPSILMVWVKYHRAWLDALDFAHKNMTLLHSCYGGFDWKEALGEVARELGANPANLGLISAYGQKFREGGNCCCEGIQNWQSKVQERVDALPKFSTLP